MTDEFDSSFEVLPQAPKHRHGKLIGSVAAVVVLAGGGAATYVAFASGDSGAGSAKAAVQKVVADLEKSDLIGVLDDLVPGERAALSAPVRADIASLKRLGVLTKKADPSSVPGVHFAAHNLTYADKTVTINDHVQIVTITGGTVDVAADAAKLPLTQKFLGMAAGAKGKASQHADLAGKQVRIAAEKVGNRWYASLFYTVADQAAQHAIPSVSDRVPATGADSPDGAVQKMVRALLSGDARSALALISPDELGAVHDYGGMILARAPKWGPAPVTITTLDLTQTPISDGGVRVGLKKLVLSTHGKQFSLAIANGCASISTGSTNKKICPADAAAAIANFIGGFSCGSGFSYGSSAPAYSSTLHITRIGSGSGKYSPLNGGSTFSGCADKPGFTKAQKQTITDLVAGLTKLGIDTAQAGGKWFVAPVRTFTDLGATVLSGLKGDDLFQLAKLGS